jgi:hypothetical protein
VFETTAKGTGLGETAGQEDPFELDFQSGEVRFYFWCSYMWEIVSCGRKVKYHNKQKNRTGCLSWKFGWGGTIVKP